MNKQYNKDSEIEIKSTLNKEEIDNYLKSPLPNEIRLNFNNSINRNRTKKKDYKKFGNNEEAKNSNNSTSEQRRIKTPKIKTKYFSILERLNTNIYLLKGEYENLMKHIYNCNKHTIYLQNRNLVFDVKANKNKIKSKIKQYKIIKEAEQNKEKEKNMKMKEEYNKNKKMKLSQKKDEVEQIRKTEENNFHKYKDNLEKIRKLKIKVKEEEKQYIKEKLSQQKDRYKKDIELRKRINREKDIKNAERLDGYRVYALRQKENELRSKLKNGNSLKKELSDQFYNILNTNIDEDIKVKKVYIYSN